jgi:ABC-type glycerol-3-phosphate transport system substrate-binding protein
VRRALVTTMVLAALALGACGGDDDEEMTPTTTAGATGATGAQDTGGGASYDITAGEFIQASIPDQIKAVQDFVADNPDVCANVDPKPGDNFMQGVAIAAASGDTETPLSEVIPQECEQAG